MKTHIFSFIGIFLIALGLQAQAPEKLNYQGIARDNTGAPMANQQLGIRIKIMDGTEAVFTEAHQVATNAYGLYTLAIGDGSPIAGQMGDVDWSTGNKFINIAIDPNGGTYYSNVGSTQLLSVPYAMYAQTSGNNSGGGGSPTGAAGGDLTGTYPDPSIANGTVTSGKLDHGAVTSPKIADMGATSGQVLKYDGTNWAPGMDNGGSGATYTAGDGINISGSDEISATLGTDITTSELQDAAITSPKIDQMSATNGQVLKWDGSAWNPADDQTGGGGTADDWGNQVVQNTARLSGDGTTGSPMDIAQQSATNGQVLKWDGTTWTPADDETATSGTGDDWGSQIAETDATLNGDGTSGNELGLADGAVTSPKLSDDAVTTAKVNDAAITSPKIDQMSATSGQVLKWDGSAWNPADDQTGGGGTADDWGSQVVQNTARLSGDGTTGSPMDIAQQSATNGQVLKWDGTTWTPADDETATSGSGDDWGSQTAQTDATLNGDGTSGNELGLADGAVTPAKLNDDAVTSSKIADMGASFGQVLKYDGSNWAPGPDNGSTVWSTSGNSTYYVSGNVGIGTNTPTADLDVDGTIQVDGGSLTALRASSTGTNASFTAEIENTSGTVLGIGNGITLSGYPTTPTGIRIQSADGHQGIFATSTDERAIYGQTQDGGDAIEGHVFSGSGKSGYFHGGSGVLINDGLETDDIEITQQLLDNTSSGGTSGQVLTSTGSGIEWQTPSGGATAWGFNGNAVGNSDFIGTTNNQPLRFKYNGNDAGFISDVNLALGNNGMPESTAGGFNTAIGIKSLQSNTSGQSNTALGSETLFQNTTGEDNTALGYASLRNNTTGNYNTGTGREALLNNTTGSSNVASGYKSLIANTTGSANTAVGYHSLFSNTTANYNTANGWSALQSNTIGENNSAFGHDALSGNTTGGNNTAMGQASLYANTVGDFNVANGYQALKSNTSGDLNTAVGALALKANTDGFNNAALGGSSLRNNTTGGRNNAFGYRALDQNTTGGLNTAMGYFALEDNTTGDGNTGLGYRSNVGAGDLTHATAIGYRAMVEQDNSLVLGSIDGVNSATVDTKVGIGTTTPSHRLNVVGDSQFENGKMGVNFDPTSQSGLDYGGLIVDGDGASDNLTLISGASNPGTYSYYATSFSLIFYRNGGEIGGWDASTGAYTSISDRRLKENITSAGPLLDKVKKIKIKRYDFKRDPNHNPQIGYIAQELEKQFPEFVNKPAKDKNRDNYYTVNYAGMSAVAIKAIQEQQETIDDQKEKIKTMEEKLNSLEARLSALENQN